MPNDQLTPARGPAVFGIPDKWPTYPQIRAYARLVRDVEVEPAMLVMVDQILFLNFPPLWVAIDPDGRASV